MARHALPLLVPGGSISRLLLIFEEDFPPYLPIALGAGDATLLDITSAYTTFPIKACG